MIKQTLTRTELYEMVWSEPMRTIAKRYNISDVGLRKICIRKNIPVPERGHWTRIRFGYEVRNRKLNISTCLPVVPMITSPGPLQGHLLL